MLGEPGPTQADPTDSWYAFEKGAEKLAGGDGFADAWKRGFFASEYRASARTSGPTQVRPQIRPRIAVAKDFNVGRSLNGSTPEITIR
jgi:hypothetical protein